MKIEEIMTRDVITVTPRTPIQQGGEADGLRRLRREGAWVRPVLETLMVETRESRRADPGTD